MACPTRVRQQLVEELDVFNREQIVLKQLNELLEDVGRLNTAR